MFVDSSLVPSQNLLGGSVKSDWKSNHDEASGM